ncbi:MAG: hypothetical protein R6V75_05735 [Bacteroidales bacterium]
MKTKTWLITSALSSLLLFLPGCLDIYLTTQLFPNGEVEKTIVIKGDSTEILKAPFFFMQDNDWTRNWTEGDDKDKKNLILTRRFRSVKELNLAMNPADTTILTIRVQSTIQRKFRWFFTYLEYSETVLKADPFKTQDWRDYLTEEEFRLIRIKDEEQRNADPDYDEATFKQAEEKYFQFIMRSMFNSYLNCLESVVAADPKHQSLREELSSRREELYNFLVDSIQSDDSDDLLHGLDAFYQKNVYTGLMDLYPEPFRQFDNKKDFWDLVGANSYKFIIRMPGLLMNTTSNQVQGLENRWELAAEDFLFDDYTMSCESRIINTWAFWVAGFILLLAIGTFVQALIRRTGKGFRSRQGAPLT